jgi:hypothetical protein
VGIVALGNILPLILPITAISLGSSLCTDLKRGHIEVS